MPTIYAWEYDGGEDGSEEAKHRGAQRAFAGDAVIDDMFGYAIIETVSAGYVHLKLDKGGGVFELKERTAGHVRTVKNLPEREANKPTGRRGTGIAAIFGTKPAAVTPVPASGGRGGKRGLEVLTWAWPTVLCEGVSLGQQRCRMVLVFLANT